MTICPICKNFISKRFDIVDSVELENYEYDGDTLNGKYLAHAECVDFYKKEKDERFRGY